MFTLLAHDGLARRGRLSLAHGQVETPIFMPVGTVGSVKTLTPRDLHEVQAQIILGNTYHLFLRPGLEVIEAAGGLHRFIGWDKPMLTDSGGFQIFSLGKLTKLSEEGAAFASHLDGTKFMLSPEKVVHIQETLGSDIHMVLDECTPWPCDEKQARLSMERSMRWADRCRRNKKRPELAQFGIVQGGEYDHLRQESIAALTAIGFEGYAIGGLSVGEPKEIMQRIIEVSCANLPSNAPRYLMGVGTPLDLIEAVALGIDMFDCVMPTRNGRNGTAFTSRGKVTIKNAQFKFDQDPLDPHCPCYTCTTHSRSYLRHLWQANELSILRLLTVHNLTFYLTYMEKIRNAISAGTFAAMLREQRAVWR